MTRHTHAAVVSFVGFVSVEREDQSADSFQIFELAKCFDWLCHERIASVAVVVVSRALPHSQSRLVFRALKFNSQPSFIILVLNSRRFVKILKIDSGFITTGHIILWFQVLFKTFGKFFDS